MRPEALQFEPPPGRACACGCGCILPRDLPAKQRYLNQRHWTNSAAHSQVRRPTARQQRQNNHEAHLCPCETCRQVRAADRSALIAKVAAEMGVPVAKGPAKKRTISPASLAKAAADRRAWYEAHGYTASVA